jgi:acyl-CoA dehydrogenase
VTGGPRDRLIEAAGAVSETVLRRWAAEVDREGRFPRESVAALRDARLMGYFVPDRFGGFGGDLTTFSRIAAILGESCLSTAMIWAMHGQQVASLADHGEESHGETLEEIAREGPVVGSVTSEYGKGGDLLTALAPLVARESGYHVRRAAPVVTAGGEAGLYLVTMRAGEDKPTSDVRLVCVRPGDGRITVEGGWDAMGMRGTTSVPMKFDVTVACERVLATPFRAIALQSMIPVGHVGWVASWFGAARGAVRRVIRGLREGAAKGGRKLGSELLLERLAGIRVSLDLIESLLGRVASELDGLRRERAPFAAYQDIRLNLLINNLKVAGSTLAFSVADRLIELVGLNDGYLRRSELGLERTFRDLRSAALMFSNDRLLAANGKLMLVESSGLSGLFG